MPEWFVIVATSELMNARCHTKLFKELADSTDVGWTMTHSFFANIGGFQIDLEGHGRLHSWFSCHCISLDGFGSVGETHLGTFRSKSPRDYEPVLHSCMTVPHCRDVSMSLLLANSRIYCYLGQRDALNWVIRSHTTQLYSFSGPGQEIILLELLVLLSLLGRSTNSECSSPLHCAWS